MMGALILQALDSPSRMVSVIRSICTQSTECTIVLSTDRHFPPARRVRTILRFAGRDDPAFSASSITVAEHRAS